MKATRKDVAQRAGVSEQTVSYILNKSRKFSQDVEARVHNAVKELNYLPNMTAKSLVTNKNYSVSVIVHDISNPIFNEIMVGFQEAAHEHDYFVTLCDAHHEIDKYVSNLIARNTEGVFIYVLAAYDDISFLERFIDCDVKIVLGGNIAINKKKISKHVSIIDADHIDGMHQIIDYLADLGHEDIVYLSGIDIHSKLDHRYHAFHDYYEKVFKRKAQVIENIAPFDTTPESGYFLAKKLIESNKPFTALVTTNDLMAYGVIEYLNEHGIQVPNDVSVIGIDDLKFSKYYNPKLTSLGFDKKMYGKVVFEQLYSMIHLLSDVKDVRIQTTLIKRESCKKIST